MTTSFLTETELKNLGLKTIGRNVLISRKASFYGNSNIEIGDNVRIDDFCIISGKVKLGNNIHISAYVALYGAFGIEMKDYTGISPKSTIYSAMDDFSGEHLIGPIHPANRTDVRGGKVLIEKFAHIGCNSVIFPNLTISEGTVVGAMSLVNKTTEAWSVYYGQPAKYVKKRSQNLTQLVD